MRVGEDELPSLEYIEDPYIPKLDNCLTPSLDDISEYNVEELLGDEQNWPEETEQYLRSLTLDQILGVSSDEDIDPDPDGFLEMQTVETEFSPQLNDSRGNGACGATNLRSVEPGDGVGGAVMRNLLAHRLLNGRQASKLNQLFSKRRIRDVRVTFIDFSKPYLARISSGDNYKSFLNIGSATGMGVLSLNKFTILKSHNCIVSIEINDMHRKQNKTNNVNISPFHAKIVLEA